MTDDIPTRMFYAGRRWRITDTPTRLRHSIWDQPTNDHALYGWRFQATDEDGATTCSTSIARKPAGTSITRTAEGRAPGSRHGVRSARGHLNRQLFAAPELGHYRERTLSEVALAGVLAADQTRDEK